KEFFGQLAPLRWPSAAPAAGNPDSSWWRRRPVMVTVHHKPAYLVGGSTIVFDSPEAPAQLRQLTGSAPTPDEARRGTIAHGILAAHNTSGSEQEMKIKFDCLASHDITYVGIIQTAKASGLEQFP